MDWRHVLLELLREWRTEPALFLYMLASFIKFPVFQNLLFEKSCFEIYDHDVELCQNVTAYHEDARVQAEANRLFFFSSLCLVLPSIPSSLFLGAMVDRNRIRVSLLIPLSALLISSLNYILLSVFIFSSPYLLLLSDLIFGVAGGYISIIGVSVAYAVRGAEGELRSLRVARLEGSIGLGATVGSGLSGTLRKALGYTGVFSLMLVLQLLALLYIIFCVRDKAESYEDVDESVDVSVDAPTRVMQGMFLSPFRVLSRQRPLRILFLINVFAFALELFAFAGMTDIQYSFMRFRLAWDDEIYGWFSGLSSAFGTLGVVLLYPVLRSWRLSDPILGSVGLLSKVVFLVVISFSYSSTLTLILSTLTLTNRFVSTAFRTTIANLVENDEQGVISSFLSILEGLTGLLATTVLNNLYPLTLPVWSGICPLSIAVLLTVSLFILLGSALHLTRQQHQLNPDN